MFQNIDMLLFIFYGIPQMFCDLNIEKFIKKHKIREIWLKFLSYIFPYLSGCVLSNIEKSNDIIFIFPSMFPDLNMTTKLSFWIELIASLILYDDACSGVIGNPRNVTFKLDVPTEGIFL